MNVRFVLAAGIALTSSFPVGADTGPAIAIEQPRPFAYTIGDVLTQRIRLQAGGQALDLAELPRSGPVGVSLVRRTVREEEDISGSRWLVMQYQVINTPSALAVWELPAVQLTSADGRTRLAVPAWPFSVGPFTPRQPFGTDGLGALRSDHDSPQRPLAPLERRLQMSLAALVLVLLSWGAYAWWRHAKIGREMPFSRALRDMRKLPDNSPAAWRRLQHAFNDAAGQVVRAGTLDRLIARAPYLESERAALERYCHEATALFFAGSLPPGAISPHQLVRRLRRIERWHA